MSLNLFLDAETMHIFSGFTSQWQMPSS